VTPSLPPARPTRLTIVLAEWCPHCVPLSEEYTRKLADRLGIPVRRLDIDVPREEEEADRIVRAHGDWAPDYLIPQVFLEWSDGRVEHILTGFSEAVARTRQAWQELFRSEWLQKLSEASA
jgi:glutaredoxin